MKVYFIGAGPGEPELLTIRAKRLIEEAGIIVYAGSLVNRKIIDEYGRKAFKVYDSSKLNLDELKEIFLEAARLGLDVARIHSGEPSIYGAIAEQIAILEELGIEYEVVPGISSFQLAAARLGAELTVPGLSQTVVLTRVSGRTHGPSLEELSEQIKTKPTLVLFLSISMLDSIVDVLKKSYSADTPVVVAYRVGWHDERIVRGTLSDIKERLKPLSIKKTALIMVGDVFGKRGTQSCLYDPLFSHGYRKGR